MNLYETYSISINSIGLFLVILGLFYNAHQTRLARRVHRENHEWNRRKAAQDILLQGRMDTSGLAELTKELYEKKDDGAISLDFLQERFKQNPNFLIAVNKMLNYHEALAVGINQGIYDEQVIKHTKYSTMKRTFHIFSNYIHYSRTKQLTAFEEQETLISSWNERPKVRDKTGS